MSFFSCSLEVSDGSFKISINFLWNSSGSDRSKEAGLEALVSGSGSGSENKINNNSQ